MIVITPLEFDIEGALVLHEDSNKTEFGEVTRRQNRIATLDGESVLQDRGYSNTDLTFSITVKQYDSATFNRLRQIVQSFPVVRLSCRKGSFLGTMRKLSDEDASFDFLVTAND